MLGLIDPGGVVRTARGALPSEIARRRLEGRGRRARAHARRPRERRARGDARRAAAGLDPAGGDRLVVAISTAVFVLADHLDLLDAIYFTATTMATVGYGDINLLAAPGLAEDLRHRADGDVSAVLLASVLAFVTDVLVSQRIDRALGRFPRPRKDHVIVCGLGKVGGADPRGAARARHPVHRGRAAPGRLRHRRRAAAGDPGRVRRRADAGRRSSRCTSTSARAVMAVTSDDLANLQCGLAAREHAPDVRVVLRVFDPRLAERLDRGVELDLTRSVSALAAPAFAAALLGRPLAEPMPLSNMPLRVLEAALPIDSPLVGRTIRDVQAEGELRILAVDGRWRPRTDLELTAQAQVSVVGTREACDALLAG